VIDLNRMQVEGDTDRVVKMAPIADKWRAFGFHVCECDGHDVAALLSALDSARAAQGKPSVILAHTIAGRGVPFLEGQLAHHMKLPKDMADAALRAPEPADQSPSQMPCWCAPNA
jgi:transketolase